MSINEQHQQQPRGVRYSSKLMSALNRFTHGLATEVRNPMQVKYGKAYDYLVSGDALRYREEIDTAIHQYQLALSECNDFPEAFIGLAKCLRRKGDSLGAVRYYNMALEQNAFRKDVHIELAKCYTECGHVNKAIHHYERAIKIDPELVEARFGLALVVEMSQDTQYAIRLYSDILELDADFLPAYNNLASLYMRLGLFQKSEELFRLLIAKAPEFTRGYLGLAITLDKAGRKREALLEYQRVLTMKPNSRNGEFIEKRIIQLNKDLGHTKSRRNTTLVRVK